MRLARRIGIALTALLLGFAGAIAAAHPVAASGLPQIEPFVDALMAQQLRDRFAPGAVVIVVKDGQIVLAKGYGDARAGQTHVDPARSLFRIASISKLFAATAILQLVEQGKLSLDADAGHMVGVKLRYPVTVRNLLTHRGGFEDSFTGIFSDPAQPVPPIADVIAAGLPRQAFRPGGIPAYSNHGFLLLGRVVEKVSGVRYDDYIRRNVFDPLGMAQASAAQPVPAALRGDVVGAYSLENGRWEDHGFEMVAASPGGAISLSGGAMARFMLALLADRPGVLSGKSRDLAITPAARFDDRASAMGLGFPLQVLNGHRAWYHTGGIDYASCRLTALPDEHFAIFVAYNAAIGAGGDADVIDAVLDRYFPDRSAAAPPIDARRRPIAAYLGAYQTSGSFFASFPALDAAAGQVFIEDAGGGDLRAVQGDTLTLWRAAAHDRFRQISGSDKGKLGDMVFQVGNGQARAASFARVNQPTRISLRREGLWDWRVAAVALRWLDYASAVIAVLLIANAARRSARRRLMIAATALGLSGVLAYQLCIQRYGAGAGGLIDRQEFGLALNGATRLTLAVAPLACGLLGLGGLAALWSAIAGRQRADALVAVLLVAAAAGLAFLLHFWKLL